MFKHSFLLVLFSFLVIQCKPKKEESHQSSSTGSLGVFEALALSERVPLAKGYYREVGDASLLEVSVETLDNLDLNFDYFRYRFCQDKKGNDCGKAYFSCKNTFHHLDLEGRHLKIEGCKRQEDQQMGECSKHMMIHLPKAKKGSDPRVEKLYEEWKAKEQELFVELTLAHSAAEKLKDESEVEDNPELIEMIEGMNKIPVDLHCVLSMSTDFLDYWDRDRVGAAIAKQAEDEDNLNLLDETEGGGGGSPAAPLAAAALVAGSVLVIPQAMGDNRAAQTAALTEEVNQIVRGNPDLFTKKQVEAAETARRVATEQSASASLKEDGYRAPSPARAAPSEPIPGRPSSPSSRSTFLPLMPQPRGTTRGAVRQPTGTPVPSRPPNSTTAPSPTAVQVDSPPPAGRSLKRAKASRNPLGANPIARNPLSPLPRAEVFPPQQLPSTSKSALRSAAGKYLSSSEAPQPLPLPSTPTPLRKPPLVAKVFDTSTLQRSQSADVIPSDTSMPRSVLAEGGMALPPSREPSMQPSLSKQPTPSRRLPPIKQRDSIEPYGQAYRESKGPPFSRLPKVDLPRRASPTASDKLPPPGPVTVTGVGAGALSGTASTTVVVGIEPDPEAGSPPPGDKGKTTEVGDTSTSPRAVPAPPPPPPAMRNGPAPAVKTQANFDDLDPEGQLAYKKSVLMEYRQLKQDLKLLTRAEAQFAEGKFDLAYTTIESHSGGRWSKDFVELKAELTAIKLQSAIPKTAELLPDADGWKEITLDGKTYRFDPASLKTDRINVEEVVGAESKALPNTDKGNMLKGKVISTWKDLDRVDVAKKHLTKTTGDIELAARALIDRQKGQLPESSVKMLRASFNPSSRQLAKAAANLSSSNLQEFMLSLEKAAPLIYRIDEIKSELLQLSIE